MKKRKDGRYQTKVTLLNGKYKFIYGKTAKEVKVKKEQLLLQVSMGGTRINDKITVQDWAEKWWKIAKEGRTGNSSQDGYIRAMNHYIFPHIGGMKLRDVKNIHIQQLINDIGESGK